MKDKIKKNLQEIEELVFSNEILEKKEVERKLRVSEEIYRRLFETARDGILILDSHTGKITDVNPFLIQLLGYSKKEFLGKKLWEVGAFKNISESKETFKVLQETGYARYDNLPLEASDGRYIEVEFISNAYMAGDERVMQCNIRDISERKRLETADKMTVLLDQEKVKNRFIADATHELRTPLAIIKGNVELALRNKDKKLFPKATLNAINLEINHLAELLSDLTILTRESDDFHKKIVTHKVLLSELITRVAEKCKTIALTKKIVLITKNITPGLVFIGDKSYLEKLFSNIISNAIYYGKENGSVIISASQNKKNIQITIEDDGIGIKSEDIPNIFNRFYRADNARTASHEGTGLGLAIAKWVAEAHNGSIDVTSVLKKGTTFTITLPL